MIRKMIGVSMGFAGGIVNTFRFYRFYSDNR